MKYEFKCKDHGVFEIDAPIADGPPDVVYCEECEEEANRVYKPLVDIWHTQGAHRTDYDKTGDRLEKMNKAWSKATGTKPPEPAKDVPKNLSEPY